MRHHRPPSRRSLAMVQLVLLAAVALITSTPNPTILGARLAAFRKAGALDDALALVRAEHSEGQAVISNQVCQRTSPWLGRTCSQLPTL